MIKNKIRTLEKKLSLNKRKMKPIALIWKLDNGKYQIKGDNREFESKEEIFNDNEFKNKYDIIFISYE